MGEIIETNSIVTRLGISNMNVEVCRKIIKDELNDIQYLSFSFFQQSDTAGTTEVTINAVTKKEVLELAKEIKKLAASFE